MRKWFISFCITTILLGGCSGQKRASEEVVKKEYIEMINQTLQEGELIKYFDGDIKIVDSINDNKESLTFYDFILEGKLNSDFDGLLEEDKYVLLKELDDSIFFMQNCGESSECSVDTFTLASISDTYTVSPSSGFSIDKNGEYYKPEADDTFKTNTDSDSGRSTSSNNQAIYEYMKLQYDELTNFGENYIPEIHDSQVSELAAAKFGISAEEASEIYIEEEMSSN